MLGHSLFTFFGNDGAESAGSLKLVNAAQDVAKTVEPVIVGVFVAKAACVVLEHFKRAG
jgi:hypothetical protein